MNIRINKSPTSCYARICVSWVEAARKLEGLTRRTRGMDFTVSTARGVLFRGQDFAA